jgi:hypothetical protein
MAGKRATKQARGKSVPKLVAAPVADLAKESSPKIVAMSEKGCVPKLEAEALLAAKLELATKLAPKLEAATNLAPKLEAATELAPKLEAATKLASKLEAATKQAPKLEAATKLASKFGAATNLAPKLAAKSLAPSIKQIVEKLEGRITEVRKNKRRKLLKNVLH